MRIITGHFKGLKLCSFLKHSYVRPMTDRVKTSLFDTLIPYIGPHTLVLDLFSGTGSLGLEALSRGVKHVWFVDNNRKSIDIMKKNIALILQSRLKSFPDLGRLDKFSFKKKNSFDISEEQSKFFLKSSLQKFGYNVSLIKRDVFSFLKEYRGLSFDLILADPPFKKMYGEKILDHLRVSKAIKTNTILAIELSSRENMLLNGPCVYNCFKEKKFGDKKVLFYIIKV